MYYLICCLLFVFLISVTVFFSSGSFFKFHVRIFMVFFFFICLFVFVLIQLSLSLLILLNLYLVLYIPLFFGCFVRGCLTVFQWRPVLLSSHFSQFRSAAQPCPALCNPVTAACQASLSITNSQSLLRLMSIESVMTSNHLILLYHSPPAFNLSQHQGSKGARMKLHFMAHSEDEIHHFIVSEPEVVAYP